MSEWVQRIAQRIRAGAVRPYRRLLLTSVEAFIGLLAILVGLPILINPGIMSPTSVMALLPLWGVYLWASHLVLGGTLILVGIVGGVRRIERGGGLVLGAASAVYAGALVLLFGPSVLLPVTTYSALAAAMFARYVVLGREIRSDHSGGNSV